MRKFFAFLFFALLVLSILFLVSRKPTKKTPPSSFNQLKTSNSEEKETVKEIKMLAKKWQFEPNIIQVKMGQKIRLKIKSVDVTHGFSLPQFSVDQQLTPQQETTIEFVADKKGVFPFFCSVYCGAGHSEMTGKLIVE